MKLQPWQTAYNLLNKKVERFYPSFQELHVQLKKGGVLIAYKAYVAFMVFISIITLITSFVVSLVILPFVMNIPFALSLLASVVIAASTALLSMLGMYLYPAL